MSELKYIGIIDGLETWEVYLNGELIGLNQVFPNQEEITNGNA